jgi:hypothetical protein
MQIGFFVGKPEGKRPLGRLRHMLENNIKTDITELGWGGMNWIDVTEDKGQWRSLLNTVMNLRSPQNVGNFLNILMTTCFSRRTQLHGVSQLVSQSRPQVDTTSES